MNRLHKITNKSKKQKGQSLVEVALFFPIFIVMLAGMVEVANLLVTQNRVTSATRSSTRFAANGGEDDGITTVLLNTVTQTLNFEEDVWDVWAVRGTINEQGTAVDPETWQFNHIYGISNTQEAGTVNESAIRADILDQLQRDELGNPSSENAAGLRFVGTYAIHDVDSILGLDAMPALVGFTSVKELTVMRLIGFDLEATDGCTGFPIAVHEGVRSVTAPNTGSNPFPNANQFEYPSPPPEYQYFFNHTPDTPLLNASEGDIFKVQNGFGEGNFGWLQWNEYVNQGAGTLDGSLTWPGNSDDYTSVANGQPTPGFPHPVYGFIENGDPSDTDMHVGDWVTAGPGSVAGSGVDTVLNGHIDNERTLRLIVWNNAQGQGSNGRYQISGFAIFRLLGYRLNQGQGGSWILAEFIRWDDSCGQQ